MSQPRQSKPSNDLPQPTIDSEVESLITTFILQYDQKLKIGNKRNIEAVERHKTAITKKIAQEANKAVIAELENLIAWYEKPHNNQWGERASYYNRRIKTRLAQLTADKEQNEENRT